MKDLIKNYIQIPAKIGYEAAKNQLYQLHGDMHIVHLFFINNQKFKQ